MSAASATIAAPATATGTSAIAVVRVSGPACRPLTEAIFGPLPPPRAATHGHYRDLAGTVVDDVVYTFFEGPASFTGEDTLEISTHGNPLITHLVLQDLFKRDCRAAEPGEFTRRAFLNGRLDLSQAEAVMDLVHARSERALAAAHRQLQGGLGDYLTQLTDELLHALARIEAYVDFPEEDLPPEDRSRAREMVANVLRGTSRLLATQRYGELLRQGIRTVILGEPNVGKSSLLNALLGRERALVSDQPGTTRDYLEEGLIVGPHQLRLIDTAGLNPTPGELEELGMHKTYERIAEADLVLWVLDARRPAAALPAAVTAQLQPAATLVILNKIDQCEGGSAVAEPPAGFGSVAVSALYGTGLEALEKAIIAVADRLQPDAREDQIAVNARHADALRRARDDLQAADEKLAQDGAVELLASDLRSALDALGEIAGRIDNEAMLDQLFATFCIGK